MAELLLQIFSVFFLASFANSEEVNPVQPCTGTSNQTIYDFTVPFPVNTERSLKVFKGKALLITNVATF